MTELVTTNITVVSQPSAHFSEEMMTKLAQYEEAMRKKKLCKLNTI